MRTLDRALRGWQGKARPIEIPFRGVQELVDFRTGDIAILAGAPGGGKSLLSLNWAWRTSDPILYLAQDSPRSVLRRLTAMALGRRVAEVHEEDADHYAHRMREQIADHHPEMIVDTSGSQTVEMVEEKIVALTEWLGEPPRVVFIDNLIDLKSEGSLHMENAFYADVLPKIKQVAIKQDVGVVLLHHVTRRSDSGQQHGLGTSKLRMNDLLFAGEREARLVFGVYRGHGDRGLWFQILKNQDGRADPAGGLQVHLAWEPEQGRLYDQ